MFLIGKRRMLKQDGGGSGSYDPTETYEKNQREIAMMQNLPDNMSDGLLLALVSNASLNAFTYAENDHPNLKFDPDKVDQIIHNHDYKLGMNGRMSKMLKRAKELYDAGVRNKVANSIQLFDKDDIVTPPHVHRE